MKVISDSKIFNYLIENLNRETLINDFQPLILDALRAYQQKPQCVPDRTVSGSNTAGADTTHLFMPCVLPNNVGIKIVSGGPTNARARLGFQGLVNVLDEYTGELKAVLNAKNLTGFRTALASSCAMVKVIDIDSDTPLKVTVFGAGAQAFWHVFLACKLYKVSHITVVSRNLDSAVLLVLQLAKYVDLPVTPLKLEDNEVLALHVRQSAVVFGCTPSSEGIILGEYLDSNPDTIKFVSLIGSYKPHMIELDLGFLRTHYKDSEKKMIVDSKLLCLAEAGEIIQCGIDESQLFSIADLPQGPISSKFVTLTGVVVCKMVGLSAEDIVVAKFLSEVVDGVEIDDF